MKPQAAPRERERRGLALAALAAVGLLGLGALVQPFTWDQAVFALGAERVLAGGRLYLDYWDFKQPGIFWWFALAGRVLGLDEFGAHRLEWLWMLATGWTLQRVSRGWLGATGSALAPLAGCGFYFAVATSWHLLQVEGLVGLPLTLSLLAAWRAARDTRANAGAWAAAGFAGGVVLLLKLALAPVLAAIWLVPAWEHVRREAAPARRARALRVTLALALGALAPLAAALAVFAAQGALARVWWTWVVFPSQLLGRLHGLPERNLAATGQWLLARWWPLLAPAALGAIVVMRRRDDGFGRSLLLWLLAGTLVFLAQRWSGWPYQVFLLLPPLALLAVRGIEAVTAAVAARWPARAARATLAVAWSALGAWALAGAGRSTLEVLRSGALVDTSARRGLLESRSGGAYAHYTKLAEVLREPGAAPGPIVVLGNPLAYWLSGRPPAIAMPGGMAIYTAREWRMLADELVAAAPAYIVLEDPMAQAIAEKAPATDPLVAVLARDYRPGPRLGPAVWLVRVRG